VAFGTFGRLFQQRIADIVAKRFVYDLEAVQVDVHDGDPQAVACACATAWVSRSCIRKRLGSPVSTS
jgi:hypothetical protein